jgi:hypothetical protein
MKTGLIIGGVVLAFALGIFLTLQFTRPKEREIINESTVLLQSVKKVLKLVTIEGELMETYKGGDIRNLTFYLPFPTNVPAPKQAIIHVKGKVLVGFDLNKMSVEMDETNKRMILSNLPEPEILSVDHELSYYNIEESWFNTFTAADYTKLNKEAKQKLRDAAVKSGLLEKAGEQGSQLLEAIRFMVESTGWTLEYRGDNQVVPIDTFLLRN